MQVTTYPDGYVIQGDCASQEVFDFVTDLGVKFACVNTDPPYGNIVDEDWDKIDTDDSQFALWLTERVQLWADFLLPGGAFYMWGGVGKVGFRPFFRALLELEEPGSFELANLLTWGKKRAYGVQNNYLWTREELAYFVKGDAKKPAVFNIPLLEDKRGYAGYNAKYPAKSEYLRRTNVWSDISEIFKGKLHPTEKAARVVEIPIEVSTKPGDWVLDPFAGSGTVAVACRKLGRRFVLIEQDPEHYATILERLSKSPE